MGKWTKYPIEKALENFIDAARRWLFEIPKNKMDKYFWIADHIIWVIFTIKILGYWLR